MVTTLLPSPSPFTTPTPVLVSEEEEEEEDRAVGENSLVLWIVVPIVTVTIFIVMVCVVGVAVGVNHNRTKLKYVHLLYIADSVCAFHHTYLQYAQVTGATTSSSPEQYGRGCNHQYPLQHSLQQSRVCPPHNHTSVTIDSSALSCCWLRNP